jgi:hypothetical protein
VSKPVPRSRLTATAALRDMMLRGSRSSPGRRARHSSACDVWTIRTPAISPTTWKSCPRTWRAVWTSRAPPNAHRDDRPPRTVAQCALRATRFLVPRLPKRGQPDVQDACRDVASRTASHLARDEHRTPVSVDGGDALSLDRWSRSPARKPTRPPGVADARLFGADPLLALRARQSHSLRVGVLCQ